MKKELQELDVDNCFNDKQIIELAGRITDTAKSYTLTHRSITVTNDKLKRDTNKVVATGRSNTVLFASIITLIRRRRKHRGITTPKPGTDEFLNYKEAASLATEFCNEFGIEMKKGYQKYIEIGMDKMVNFSVFKFKNMHAGIIKHYDAELKISSDKYPEQTKRAHSVYLKLIQERIGFAQGFEKLPEKYACFVEVAKISMEHGIDTSDYIRAQFQGFDFSSSIPDPYQLTGVKAIDRLQKYAFENTLKLGGNNKTHKINFSKIKNQK